VAYYKLTLSFWAFNKNYISKKSESTAHTTQKFPHCDLMHKYGKVVFKFGDATDLTLLSKKENNKPGVELCGELSAPQTFS
jgi:hypothetical protein